MEDLGVVDLKTAHGIIPCSCFKVTSKEFFGITFKCECCEKELTTWISANYDYNGISLEEIYGPKCFDKLKVNT